MKTEGRDQESAGSLDDFICSSESEHPDEAEGDKKKRYRFKDLDEDSYGSC